MNPKLQPAEMYPSKGVSVKLQEISDRQREIIALLLQGKRKSEIATLLGISSNTLKSHLSRIKWLFKIHRNTIDPARFSVLPMKILLIDDDKLLLKALSFSLSQEGYTVHTAADGSESIPLLTQNEYDVVVCDLFMPNISGFSLISRLKELFGEDLPIIVISALSNKATLEMMGLGNLDFLEKPFHVSRLAEKVKEFGKINFR
jgi:FixJ family two-component response regulator